MPGARQVLLNASAVKPLPLSVGMWVIEKERVASDRVEKPISGDIAKSSGDAARILLNRLEQET